METLNKRTLSLPSRIFKITFIVLATTFALFGCGNEDSGSSNSVTSNCYDCSSILSPLPIDTFNSESTYLNVWPVTMSAQLYVDGAYFTPGMSSSYNLYRGPVFVYGQLTVNGSQPMYDSAGYCVVRPGTYQLKTRYVGSINQGSNFEVQELVAGNMLLRMRTSSATPSMLYRSATNGQVRWMGVLEIVSVDGRLCQNFYSSMK
jgi:hypothetical protein